MPQHRPIARDMSWRLSSNRREFLRSAAGLTFGSAPVRSSFARATNVPRKKKVVVVTFGGGARDQETFFPEGQENIPNMMRDLLPRATFFTQVVNRGILGHYVATASLATGVYETINNFAALPPATGQSLTFRQDTGILQIDVASHAPDPNVSTIVLSTRKV